MSVEDLEEETLGLDFFAISLNRALEIWIWIWSPKPIKIRYERLLTSAVQPLCHQPMWRHGSTVKLVSFVNWEFADSNPCFKANQRIFCFSYSRFMKNHIFLMISILYESHRDGYRRATYNTKFLCGFSERSQVLMLNFKSHYDNYHGADVGYWVKIVIDYSNAKYNIVTILKEALKIS